MGLVEHEVQRDALAVVAEFRSELYACLTARSDALFELCDALLCTDWSGPHPRGLDARSRASARARGLVLRV